MFLADVRFFDIYITANSPGELSGFAAPVIAELRKASSKMRITLVILPCQYASGMESEVAATLGADRVSSFAACFFGKLWNEPIIGNASAMRKTTRLVLHLGGDVGFSVLLAKSMKAALDVYAQSPRWKRYVRRFYIPSEELIQNFTSKGVGIERCFVVGSPAFDSISHTPIADARQSFGFGEADTVLGIMCGSRPFEALHSLPFFAEAADILLEKFPELKIIFPMAATLNPEDVIEALRMSDIRWKGRVRPQEIMTSEGNWARMIWDRPQDAMSCCDMLIALPGTNNLQAVALRTPILVIMPLNRAWEIPLDGLAGHVPLWIPGVKSLKKALVSRKIKHMPYVSLPNRLAKKKIVPEMVGELEPEDVAEQAASMLKNKRFTGCMIPAFAELDKKYRGASARIAQNLLNL